MAPSSPATVCGQIEVGLVAHSENFQYLQPLQELFSVIQYSSYTDRQLRSFRGVR